MSPAGIVFGLSTFLGAFLLFQIQPLIAKYVLPWFGGGPGVWTVCMLFFQVVLLGGYAYAHGLQRLRDARHQAAVHVGLLLAALAVSSIVPTDRWKPAPEDNPVLHILLLLGSAVGLPYFALSATGPLLQAWFGRVNPSGALYRLYALSNVGSLLALLSYPAVIEPWLSRSVQAGFWTWGFRIFLLSMVGVAAFVVRAGGLQRMSGGTGDAPEPSAAVARPRLVWFGLPCLASVLLLAVTSVLCQDIAVVPLLWVLPLSLYLISFIVAFDSPRWYHRGAFLSIAAVASVLLSVMGRVDLGLPLSVQVAVYAAGFFACCMVCHGEVYRVRPGVRRLTEFYLFISAGGAAGGAIVALAAPVVFDSYVELPLALWVMGACVWYFASRSEAWGRPALAGWSWRSLGGATVVAAGLVSLGFWLAKDATRLFSTRNFYGVMHVEDVIEQLSLSPIRVLMHGTTMHGMQYTLPSELGRVGGYYQAGTAIHLVMAGPAAAASPRRIGVIGLGTGTLAAYARESDSLTYYEINPEVTDVAREAFTFLSSAKAPVNVVHGDARVSLEYAAPQGFDLFVVDAFNSDAIPSHLLTREAFEIYARHLSPSALMAIHISNRHLDLEPVVIAGAEAVGLQALTFRGSGGGIRGVTDWMVVGRPPALARASALTSRATPSTERRVLWTDERTSLWEILK